VLYMSLIEVGVAIFGCDGLDRVQIWIQWSCTAEVCNAGW
jgi:hypothetical protein